MRFGEGRSLEWSSLIHHKVADPGLGLVLGSAEWTKTEEGPANELKRKRGTTLHNSSAGCRS